MDELIEMRRQLAAMKESLDKSQIVNQTLMRKVMGSKASFLSRVVIWECIAIPFVFLIILANCVHYEATLWVAWAFLIGAVVSTAIDFKTIRISSKEINRLSLIGIKQHIIKQKRQRHIQTLIEIPAILIWIAWAYIEWFKPGNYYDQIRNGDPLVWTIIINLIILTIISVAVALWIMRKIDKANDTMIASIDVFQDGTSE